MKAGIVQMPPLPEANMPISVFQYAELFINPIESFWTAINVTNSSEHLA